MSFGHLWLHITRAGQGLTSLLRRHLFVLTMYTSTDLSHARQMKWWGKLAEFRCLVGSCSSSCHCWEYKGNSHRDSRSFKIYKYLKNTLWNIQRNEKKQTIETRHEKSVDSLLLGRLHGCQVWLIYWGNWIFIMKTKEQTRFFHLDPENYIFFRLFFFSPLLWWLFGITCIISGNYCRKCYFYVNSVCCIKVLFKTLSSLRYHIPDPLSTHMNV